MKQNLYTLNVVLPLDDGAINVLVEVVPFRDPNYFLVKKVAFKNESEIIPFISEFHLEKRLVENQLVWFHKERNQQTLLGNAIGNAIDVYIQQEGV